MQPQLTIRGCVPSRQLSETLLAVWSTCNIHLKQASCPSYLAQPAPFSSLSCQQVNSFEVHSELYDYHYGTQGHTCLHNARDIATAAYTKAAVPTLIDEVMDSCSIHDRYARLLYGISIIASLCYRLR